MTDDFQDQVALVTGAARGIGAAVGRALAGAGARVALTDIDADAAQRLADELNAGGRRAWAYPLDVSDGAAAEIVVKRVDEEVGPISILANVAGVLRPGRVTDLDDEDWRATFAVNTGGVFHLCRAVARLMKARRSGTIVTVGSNAAGVPRRDMAAYAASKAATSMLMKCLGLELAAYGIRCNVVAPGSTDTDMQRSLWTGPDGARDVVRGSLESFRVGIPLGRIAEPSDIAAAVLFLASGRARHITMHDLYVDGGAALGV
jgi:2,3-dihydro-2,3-dihydroxybenzoate dehydrogenase